MEAALPLSALESEENLTAAVEITIPLRILCVLEMSPHVVVDLLEPLQTLLVACELVAFDEADCRLEVYPPEFLVPLELLHRSTFDVLEIEDSAVLLVPTELYYAESDLDALVDEGLVVSADTEVHHEPKCLKVVTRVDLATFKAVYRGSVRRYVLKHHSILRMIEHIENLAETFVDSLVEHALILKDVLHFKSHDTEDGLVGRISEVGLTFSKVTTILDPALHVGAYNARTRDMGTITGRIEAAEEGLCSMELVSRSSTAAKDDIIVTAGSTGLFPKDLVIGRIVSISTESDGKSMTAMIQPAAEVDSVTNVLVVTSFRGQGSSMSELNSEKAAEDPQEAAE